MKRKYLLLALLQFLVSKELLAPPPPPVLYISEIMYNPPEEVDSLAFIELSGSTQFLGNSFFMGGIDFSFPDSTLVSGETFLIVQDSVAFENVFGIVARQWGSNTVLEPGIPVILHIPFMNDTLVFDTVSPWFESTNGLGFSMVRCINTFGQSSLPNSWQPSTHNTGIEINGYTIFGDPGEWNGCMTVDITDNQTTPHFNLYPNPNAGTFTVDFSQLQQNATLRIRNTMSQILFERQVSAGSTSLTQNIKFNKGIYLLELDDGHDCQHRYMVVTE